MRLAYPAMPRDPNDVEAWCPASALVPHVYKPIYHVAMRRPNLKMSIITAAATGLVIVLLLVGPGSHWLANYDRSANATFDQIEAARSQLLQLATGLFAVGALWFTARNYRISQKTQALAESIHGLVGVKDVVTL